MFRVAETQKSPTTLLHEGVIVWSIKNGIIPIITFTSPFVSDFVLRLLKLAYYYKTSPYQITDLIKIHQYD